MRLDKYIKECMDLSRTEIHKMVRNNWVSVNGVDVRDYAMIIDERVDEIAVEDQPLIYKSEHHLIYNKPAGILSAKEDKRHKTVYDVLDYPKKDKLSIVGRLDLDTTGLLFMTSDGDLCHKIISPKSDLFKEYLVTSDSNLSDDDLSQFPLGIVIDDEKKGLYKTLPSQIECIADCQYLLKIQEGKFHQVKKMFESLGNLVVALHRTKIGSLEIGDLAIGEYREATETELAILRSYLYKD